MQVRRSAMADATKATQQCLKLVNDRNTKVTQWHSGLEKIDPPGIRAIKKREMWKKFRPVVPERYHTLDIYGRPSEEELNELKKQRAKKAQEKKKEKQKAIAHSDERKRKRDAAAIAMLEEDTGPQSV